ncbi:metal-dependent hydrolase family protein [Sinorhizobium meliloti]|uniref:metal-dependent hydrolase family protein n=1 Tax=Rhizobium meliloti TaxID=382 RepID=UPI00036A1429|nr:amidohydrolase family protein [Sinorhizobium meliloti]
MKTIVIRNAAIVDGTADRAADRVDVLMADGYVAEVGERLKAPADARIFDAAGRFVMPGLIDCHVHVVTVKGNLAANAELPNTLVALHAANTMRGMLSRGFTTVRDMGGADQGLVDAVEYGLIEGPRLVICGKALSQTGGHTDFRDRHNRRPADYYLDQLGALGRICDGEPEVRRAAREELKAGARFVKVMGSGGVCSPTDPIDAVAFSLPELQAVVEEAAHQHTYVAAHLYTDEAIARALEAGVRSIEHGNHITPATAKQVRKSGAVVVPTNITYAALAREGAEHGMPAASLEKIDFVLTAGLTALETLREARVTMGYGSDLLGGMHEYQAQEFELRGRVLPAHEVIRSATMDAARVLQLEERVGIIAPGAFADVIVIDGDPLKDLSILADPKRIRTIIKGGRVVKDR